jgi:hypothetical protein
MWYSCNKHKYGKVWLVNKGILNRNTAISWHLMWTARTLKAEWRQVLRGHISVLGVWGGGGKGRWVFLGWLAFWNLWTIYFFNFPVFLGRDGPRITENMDTESAEMGIPVLSQGKNILVFIRHNGWRIAGNQLRIELLSGSLVIFKWYMHFKINNL